MEKVTVDRDVLLKTVYDNRSKHLREYDQALRDYKTAVLKIAQDNLELAESGELDQFKKIQGLPVRPRSYERDYDRTIRMLEMSVDPQVELLSHAFEQLVLDQWDWSEAFSVTNSSYKSFLGSK